MDRPVLYLHPGSQHLSDFVCGIGSHGRRRQIKLRINPVACGSMSAHDGAGQSPLRLTHYCTSLWVVSKHTWIRGGPGRDQGLRSCAVVDACGCDRPDSVSADCVPVLARCTPAALPEFAAEPLRSLLDRMVPSFLPPLPLLPPVCWHPVPELNEDDTMVRLPYRRGIFPSTRAS
jgi:hypothetical protein